MKKIFGAQIERTKNLNKITTTWEKQFGGASGTDARDRSKRSTSRTIVSNCDH